MNCKFCLMSRGGCIYVLVSSEQFSVVSCIHDDTFLNNFIVHSTYVCSDQRTFLYENNVSIFNENKLLFRVSW
jgi:hypothetical protein